MPKQRDAKAKGYHSQWDVKAMGCQSNIGDPLCTAQTETNKSKKNTHEEMSQYMYV